MNKAVGFLCLIFFFIYVSVSFAYAKTEQEDTTELVQEEFWNSAMKEKFVEGGWQFMTVTSSCLIFGLAIGIFKLWDFYKFKTKSNRVLSIVESCLNSHGIDHAKKALIENKKSSVLADAFHNSLLWYDRGLYKVQERLESEVSLKIGYLKGGLTWIALGISLAPMLGFMGTVIGMISAFDAIAEKVTMNPALVASGIKIALITTVAGLIIAVILQLFYNYLSAKIENVSVELEDASSSFMDILVYHKIRN